MAAVIEILIMPTILVTIAAIALGFASVSAKTIFALCVALALFYFVVISLLRFMRTVDDESEAELHPKH